MIIKNASVYTEDGIFLEKDIYIEDWKMADSIALEMPHIP